MERDFHNEKETLLKAPHTTYKLESDIKRLTAELREREDDIDDLREAKR